MNISIKQTSSNFCQWQGEIHSYAKRQKELIRMILARKDCSRQVKIGLIQGLKEVLKVKLSEVDGEKQRFVLGKKKQERKGFEFSSEKEHLIISNRNLKEVSSIQAQLLAQLQELITKKNTLKNQKKNELKSVRVENCKHKLFQSVVIPNTKMTSSIIIESQSSIQINRSIRVGNNLKAIKQNVDKSLQLGSKAQTSQIYKNEICSFLLPILQESRQIVTKNKSLIRVLKEGHKSQAELNLWLKEIKLASLKVQVKRLRLENEKNDLKLQEENKGIQLIPLSDGKNNSDTTGSPDQKEAISPKENIKQSIQTHEVGKQKAISTRLFDDFKSPQKPSSQQKSQIQLLQDSPPTGRKMSQKIDRPSSCYKKINAEGLQDDNLSARYSSSRSSGFTQNRFSNTLQNKFNVIEERLEERQENRSKSLSNPNVKKQIQFSNEKMENSQSQLQNSFKLCNSPSSDSYKMENKSSRMIMQVNSIIPEEDEDKNLESASSQSSNSQELIEKLIKEAQIKTTTNEFKCMSSFGGQRSNRASNYVENKHPQKVNQIEKSFGMSNSQSLSNIPIEIPSKSTNIFNREENTERNLSKNIFNSENKENSQNLVNSNKKEVQKESKKLSNTFQNPSPFGLNKSNSHQNMNVSHSIFQQKTNSNVFTSPFTPSSSSVNPFNQPRQNMFKQNPSPSSNPFSSQTTKSLSPFDSCKSANPLGFAKHPQSSNPFQGCSQNLSKSPFNSFGSSSSPLSSNNSFGSNPFKSNANNPFGQKTSQKHENQRISMKKSQNGMRNSQRRMFEKQNQEDEEFFYY